MRTPIFVRPLTDAERQALSAGLRSKDTFVVRRCQILLASARGERAPRIAEHLSCDDQTVLEGLHAFNAHGLDALVKRSSRAHHRRPQAFPGERAEQLRALLHRRPRDFGHPTSV
jgi:transposase